MEYGTFGQIRSNGGQVRKGEKSTIVVFWKIQETINEVTQKKEKKFLLRYYHVFNSEQADFDEIGQKKVLELQGIVDNNHCLTPADRIVSNYPDPPQITWVQNSLSNESAYYSANSDLVSVPDKIFFKNSESYYRVLFYELGHSTGHPKRLGRFDFEERKFASEPYSKKELVAEFCSCFLSAEAGLNLDVQNSSDYIQNWSKKLSDNTRWAMWAASQAEKAARHILNTSTDEVQVEAQPAAVPDAELVPVSDELPL